MRLRYGRSAVGGVTGTAGVGELVDDLDTIVPGPAADLTCLNGNGVRLPVTAGHPSRQERSGSFHPSILAMASG